LPRHAPGQRQVGDVHARDQQHKADRAQQHPQHLDQLFGQEVILQGFDKRAPALVAFRVGLGDVVGHPVHLGLRLLYAHARLQPSHRQQPVEVVVLLLRFENQRNDQRLVQPIRLARPQNPNHRVRRAVDLHLFADDVGIGAQPLPQLVHQDDDVLFPRDAFLRQEVAAKAKRRAQHPVHAGRGLLALQVLRLVLGGKVELAPGECRQILKGSALALPVQEVLGGDSVVEALDLRPHHHKLIRLGIGHGREQRRVDHREDGGVRPDAQRQRERSRQREDRRFDQLAHRVSHVPKQVLHLASLSGVLKPYSVRSAFMGSTAAARRAGIAAATATITAVKATA